MATSTDIQNAVDQLITDIALFHSIVQGSAGTDVPTESGLVPSVLKFYNSITASIVSGILPGFAVVQKTVSYSVVASDANNVHNLSAATPMTVTVPSVGAGGFASKFTLKWYNASGCGHLLSIFGMTNFYIYPQQTIILENTNGTWSISPRTQRWHVPDTGATVYVHTSTGSNANDGLDASRPFASIQFAWDFITDHVDMRGSGSSIYVLNSHTISNIFAVGQAIGKHIINIIGDASGALPASTLLTVNGGVGLFIDDKGWVGNLIGLELTGTSGATLVDVAQQGLCDIQSVVFGSNASGIHVAAIDFGKINFVAPVPGTGVNTRFAGNCGVAVDAERCGSIEMGGVPVTADPGISYTTAFLAANGAGAQITVDAGVSFVGGGGGSGSSGFRTLATANGIISLSGLSPSSVPGASGANPATGTGGRVI